jgi:hypothetical protein
VILFLREPLVAGLIKDLSFLANTCICSNIHHLFEAFKSIRESIKNGD